MGNCFLGKTKKITSDGITYYELPSYLNKNVQYAFQNLSSKYPDHAIMSINNPNEIPNRQLKQTIYISYDVGTQLVTNVKYFS